MFFRKKGALRREFDEILFNELERVGTLRTNQRNLVNRCFEPSEELITEVKITEAKYYFLLKEAKNRQLKLRK